jgi:hypothetical protein
VSLRSILLTALVIAGVIYWLRARDLKQLALQAATRHCENLDLALLDESVVLKSLKWMRNSRGQSGLARCYQFEFTVNGRERYTGEIILLRRRVLSIKLPPHRID